MIRVARNNPFPSVDKVDKFMVMGVSTKVAAISVTITDRESIPGGVHLLSSGYSLPRIGFGTNTLRKRGEVFEALEAAINAGYRCFDVSAMNNNVSEIGRALEQILFKKNLERAEIFLIATVGLNHGGHKKHIKSSICNQVADYLQYLKTDYIDLILLNDLVLAHNNLDHGSDECKERRHLAWTEMERLRDEHCIRSLGVCQFTVALLNEMMAFAVKCQPAVNQIERGDAGDELLAYATEHNIYLQISGSMWKSPAASNPPSAMMSLLASVHTTTLPTLFMPVPYSSLGMGIILPSSTESDHISANLQKVVAAKSSKA